MKPKSFIPMLAVLYGSAFVASFNENTINVALISIMGEFSVEANTAQWLVTGYMVVTAIVVTTTAVSYTHLDVYKRQLLHNSQSPCTSARPSRCDVTARRSSTFQTSL